jgi:hypothetical protein
MLGYYTNGMHVNVTIVLTCVNRVTSLERGRLGRPSAATKVRHYVTRFLVVGTSQPSYLTIDC